MFKIRNFILLISDIILINLSYLIGLLLRFEGKLPDVYLSMFLKYAPLVTLVQIGVFYIFNMYKTMWRYASIGEFIEIIEATFIANILSAAILMFTGSHLPRSIYAIALILSTLLVGGTRFLSKASMAMSFRQENKGYRRTMIIGAGEAGVMVAKELKKHGEMGSIPVAFIDDDIAKIGKSILNIPVVGGRKKIVEAAKRLSIDEIIIAMPSSDRQTRMDIVDYCNKTHVKVKIVPGMYEFIDEKIDVKDIRDVEIADLLGREEVNLDEAVLNPFLKDRTVLVTGAGGTIGSELCRQILRFHPRQLIMVDIYENTLYEVQNEILRKDRQAPITVLIDSIRDTERMDRLFEKYNPEVVFHAAAHKHVPLMENSSISAVKNNIFGTLNVLKAAEKYGTKKFVNISTDKAVNPTSVMGCTKRVVEIMLQTINKHAKTEYVAVRFGNVLGSHGSVIPLFKQQIKEGGPVTVTHKDIIRYFMTIPEACQLVLQAGAIAHGGEIFVLEMGDPVKIDDLARKLISLSGFTPDVDIKIEYTGLRPGEKLYEELLIQGDNTTKTDYDMIYVEKPVEHDEEKLWRDIAHLKDIVKTDDKKAVVEALKQIVPEFTPDIKDL